MSTRSEMRHLNHDPGHYTFDRTTGLRDYHFANYRPPVHWPSVALLALAVASILVLAFIGWRMVL